MIRQINKIKLLTIVGVKKEIFVFRHTIFKNLLVLTCSNFTVYRSNKKRLLNQRCEVVVL